MLGCPRDGTRDDHDRACLCLVPIEPICKDWGAWPAFAWCQLSQYARTGGPGGPPRLATKRDPVDDLRGEGYDLYGFNKAFRVLHTKKAPNSKQTEQRNKLVLAAFKYLSEYEDEGPEDGSFEDIDVRSELKARAQGVDVFFYDKNQGAPFDGGVEVRWETWTASKIYLAPHPDEENAVAVINLKKTMSNGRSGHAYALVKPKADGGQRDFEFANYPAFLVLARG